MDGGRGIGGPLISDVVIDSGGFGHACSEYSSWGDDSVIVARKPITSGCAVVVKPSKPIGIIVGFCDRLGTGGGGSFF